MSTCLFWGWGGDGAATTTTSLPNDVRTFCECVCVGVCSSIMYYTLGDCGARAPAAKQVVEEGGHKNVKHVELNHINRKCERPGVTRTWKMFIVCSLSWFMCDVYVFLGMTYTFDSSVCLLSVACVIVSWTINNIAFEQPPVKVEKSHYDEHTEHTQEYTNHPLLTSFFRLSTLFSD